MGSLLILLSCHANELKRGFSFLLLSIINVFVFFFFLFFFFALFYHRDMSEILLTEALKPNKLKLILF